MVRVHSRSPSETQLREANGAPASENAGPASPFKVHAQAMPKQYPQQQQGQQTRPSIDLSGEGIQR